MDDQQLGYFLGWGGGLLGAILGIAGGAVGTIVPYRLAKTPRQKSFILKSAAFFVVLVAAFLAGLFLLRSPWNNLLWIPYVVVLLVSISWLNKRQQTLAAEESQTAKDVSP